MTTDSLLITMGDSNDSGQYLAVFVATFLEAAQRQKIGLANAVISVNEVCSG
jgi:hypothetical protein